MIDKLTRFELRKIIAERKLLLEEEEVEKKSFEKQFPEGEESDTIEIAFREWVNDTYSDKVNKFFEDLHNETKNFPDKKLDRIIPKAPSGETVGTGKKWPRNRYLEEAWKKWGKAFLNQHGDIQKILVSGYDDLGKFEEADWTNFLLKVQGLCERGDQSSAELLCFSFAKWHCSKPNTDKNAPQERVIIDSMWNSVEKTIKGTLHTAETIMKKTEKEETKKAIADGFGTKDYKQIEKFAIDYTKRASQTVGAYKTSFDQNVPGGLKNPGWNPEKKKFSKLKLSKD
jgi:hypothetical protein